MVYIHKQKFDLVGLIGWVGKFAEGGPTKPEEKEEQAVVHLRDSRLRLAGCSHLMEGGNLCRALLRGM